jgi:CBS domain-containing protein
MNKAPPVANANEKLLDVTKRLLGIDYNAVVVYDDGEAIGLVTIKDIVKWLVEIKDNANLVIGDLISVPLITLSGDTRLQDAVSTMNKYKINYVVIEENNTIKGLVTGSLIHEFCENYPHYLRQYT